MYKIWSYSIKSKSNLSFIVSQKLRPLARGIPSRRYAGTCYSSLKLSDLVGYLDATDRAPSRAVAVVHTDKVAVEAEEDSVSVVRS